MLILFLFNCGKYIGRFFFLHLILQFKGYCEKVEEGFIRIRKSRMQFIILSGNEKLIGEKVGECSLCIFWKAYRSLIFDSNLGEIP